MLMINFEQLKIVEVEDFLVINIILDWNPSFLDESFRTFQKALTDKVEDELDKHLLTKPVHFKFITRFDNNDLDLIADNFVSTVVDYMLAGKRTREERLGRPKDLDQVLMLDGTIMDCINNNLDTDIFNITVFNKNDKEFFSLLDGVVL